MKTFIPFHQLKNHAFEQVVIVDAIHPNYTTFSHWKGANCHKQIQADTSAEICVNAVLREYKNWNAPFITANHFDIDGFIGIMALMLPEKVKQNPDLFIQIGEIGDFRHFNPESVTSHEALKLCIWLNENERELFYVPFGEKNEIEACVQKFDFFIKEFSKALNSIDSYNSIWESKYKEVIGGFNEIISIHNLNEIRLQIVKCNKPIPYYTLFSKSKDVDLVLSIYPERKYELEYKYTTWVDIVSCTTYPRIDLRPLAKLLNDLEESIYNWHVDRITDTGPILRLEMSQISKADRFADPSQRTIFSSSIEETEFVDICHNFLKEKLEKIQPGNFWTWEEMKKINQ